MVMVSILFETKETRYIRSKMDFNVNKLIAEVAFRHFKYLPLLGKYNVTEINGLTIINCALGSSMFNIVCGQMDSGLVNLDAELKKIISKFKDQPFAWWLPPAQYPAELIRAYESNGFIVEAPEHAMICDLDKLNLPIDNPKLSFEQVKTKEHIEHFLSVLEPYDSSARLFYESISIDTLQKQEQLFVCMHNNVAVTIGILYFHGNTAGIFSLITPEQFRGRGYGTSMMKYLMHKAKASGAKYVSLSASSDSGFRIYERLGFKVYGNFRCFEWNGSNPG
jgi:ribosomal protein S18 acetylase RimI-like enzyme